MKFKIGDIVKVIKDDNVDCAHGIPVGSHVQITRVAEDGNDGFPYEVALYGNCLADDEIELVHRNQ